VIVSGFQMQNTGTSVFRVEGSHNRVTGNRMLNCGDGVQGDVHTYAIINSLVAGDHYNLIDSNSIEQPHNVALSMEGGPLGNVFSHNTIVGPFTIGAGSTMAIKVGSCSDGCYDGLPHVPTSFQFNTIQGWEDGAPYLGSSKVPFVRFLYNRIEGHSKQFLMARNSDDNMFVGNYFDDGNIVLMGARHLVRDNFVRTKTEGYYSGGPLVVYNTQDQVNAYGVYDPKFYRAFTDGQVIGNKLINLMSDQYFGVVTPIAPACDNAGITYKDNVLVGNGGTYFMGCTQNSANTYTNNAQLTPSNAGFDVNDTNPSVPYDASLTMQLVGSP
jgi:hypothetical protein